MSDRIRRVKCDERKPSCNKCTSTGRTCDGYDLQFVAPKRAGRGTSSSSGSASSRSSGSPAVQSSAFCNRIITFSFDDEHQRQSFDFFISCTVPASSTFGGRDFWATRVVQLSYAEPAIRYALCSLSALHRLQAILNGDEPGSFGTVEYKRYSLQQYALAVSHTQRLIEDCGAGGKDAIIKALVACVLFVCYENLVGNFSTAMMHLQNGLRIVSDAKNGNHKQQADFLPVDISRVLTRLDLQAMSFADDMAPYPYSVAVGVSSLPSMDAPFQDYSTATSALFDILRWILKIANMSEPLPFDSLELERCKITLQDWLAHFQRLELSPLAAGHEDVSLLLRMYHTTIHVMLGTGVFGNDMASDLFISSFQEIISLGKSYLLLRRKLLSSPSNRAFSLEVGIIVPLFYTVAHCRDPIIRRSALHLLYTCGLQEGALPSIGAAKVGEMIVDIEEEGLPFIRSAADIPLTSRICIANMAIQMEKRTVSVNCVLYPDGHDQMPVVRGGVVCF